MRGSENLERHFRMATPADLEEACLAYHRYQRMMDKFAQRYEHPLHRVVAAFVSLSPNSDYMGNLRSLVSLLEAHKLRVPVDRVVVATYNHCKLRAHAYLVGDGPGFVVQTRGLKIRSFYENIMDPNDPRFVTVDGHVVASWRGSDSMTMKQALLKPAEYKLIKAAVQALACDNRMVPCQMQAAIWFARKRHLKIRYSPQFDLFSDKSGITWETVEPYPFRSA